MATKKKVISKSKVRRKQVRQRRKANKNIQDRQKIKTKMLPPKPEPNYVVKPSVYKEDKLSMSDLLWITAVVGIFIIFITVGFIAIVSPDFDLPVASWRK